MRANLKTIDLLETAYINLSGQLRRELELKIEAVYTKDRLVNYTHGQVVSYKNMAATTFLCTYLTGRVPRNFILSGKLLQGIKIWFNMHYNDRLSVINKFSICYQRAKPYAIQIDRPGTTIIFCKFLINELLGTLAENRWQMLINHTN